MTEVLDVRDTFLAHHRALDPAPEWVERLRRSAFERFSSMGFPTGREEEWRFTDVSPVAETPFGLPGATPDLSIVGPLASGPLKACQLAFVDGRYSPGFSKAALPKEVTLVPLSRALRDHPERIEPHLGLIAPDDRSPFASLNSAFVSEGAFLHVPRGVSLEAPIHLLFLAAPAGEPFAVHPRNLIVVEEGARVRIVESFLGPGGGVYLTNVMTEILAGEGADVDYTKVQRESPDAFHFAAVQACQGRNSRFVSHSFSLGARISRNDLGVVLDGEGADCALKGLFEAAGTQVADNHTTIDHARPHGTSRELYKGILGGRARGVFDGRILVRPNAQKTNATQTNKNLLLSAEALVHTKPQLEIFANDVKCKHGATIGRLDADVLFYLRSRGIGAEEARRLLVHAFAGEIVDQVTVDAVRTQVGGCLALLALAPAGGLRP